MVAVGVCTVCLIGKLLSWLDFGFAALVQCLEVKCSSSNVCPFKPNYTTFSNSIFLWSFFFKH